MDILLVHYTSSTIFFCTGDELKDFESTRLKLNNL